MKSKWLKMVHAAVILSFLGSTWTVSAADSSWREQFDQGLLQEEVHQNLEKAVEHYQGVVGAFDEQQDVIAMSLYRLAECLRKLGRMDEAAPLYERITKEFSDQRSLVLLSQRFVAESESASVFEIKTQDEAIINHPEYLKNFINQLQQTAPDTAMLTLTQAMGDTTAGSLLARYRETQAELAQLRIRYLDKWPGIKQQQAKLASLEVQMRKHVGESIKLLKIRLTTLETAKAAENERKLIEPKQLTNDPRTLRLLIEELEKAPTEIAFQMLIQETDLKIVSHLESEKTSIQLDLVEKRREYGEQHPEIQTLTSQYVTIQKQEANVVKRSIQQLKIKLRVLERVHELSKFHENEKAPETEQSPISKP
ncbi:tetratricopeptide repeat protein [bacterium]|nr:tetratricopeptide repeat protein [bacterium]